MPTPETPHTAEWLGPSAAAITLAALYLAEGVAPMFAHQRGRLAHAGRNIAMGLIGAGLRAALFTPLLLLATELSRKHGAGMLHAIAWPAAPEWAVALLLLDLWGYLWHVMSHKIPFLWRFHLVHHHDAHPDSTTAFRFHAGEIVLTSLASLLALPILGVTIPQLLLYELLLLPVALFHHANVRMPEWADRPMRLIIATPRMHWVHHSRWQPETDSNYGAILSIWDRLLGTLRLREDPAALELGLDGYADHDHATLRGMLRTPFGPIKSEPGQAPEPPPTDKP